LKEILEHRTELGSPVNNSLHEKNDSTVINKDIAFLERRYTLENS
jgi:hypothetical protein